jgi:hypothetical protein
MSLQRRSQRRHGFAARIEEACIEGGGELLEAHNRLAGVIARCERKIGQELRAAKEAVAVSRGGRPRKTVLH